MYRSEKMNNPITLKQLRVFTCIARHENLSSAAEELCLSKGAASQALQELERRLDVLLFDRVRAKLQINEDGRLLRVMAEDILARIGDIEAMFGPQIDSGGGDSAGSKPYDWKLHSSPNIGKISNRESKSKNIKYIRALRHAFSF